MDTEQNGTGIDQEEVARGFARAKEWKEVGWEGAMPVGLGPHPDGSVTTPLVFGWGQAPAPPPFGRGQIFVAIRSWNWDSENPTFELTSYRPNLDDPEIPGKGAELIFGPWGGPDGRVLATTTLAENGGIPTPQQAVRLLAAGREVVDERRIPRSPEKN